MEISTVLGFVTGIVAIVVSIFLEGDIGAFVSVSSIMIVLGGTIASTMIAFPMSELKKIPSLIMFAFKKDTVDVTKDIDNIIMMANMARRDGLLALENSLEDMKDPFLKNGIMLILDGTDPELVKNVLETEIYFMDERHSSARSMFESMAGYAPAYGMIGTLIGLIVMLVNLSDADALGPAMAVALITTFYGVIFAHLVFSPIANKLKIRSSNEQIQKDIIIEGILSIQDGENPRIIKDKLRAFISEKESEKIIDYKGTRTVEEEAGE